VDDTPYLESPASELRAVRNLQHLVFDPFNLNSCASATEEQEYLLSSPLATLFTMVRPRIRRRRRRLQGPGALARLRPAASTVNLHSEYLTVSVVVALRL